MCTLGPSWPSPRRPKGAHYVSVAQRVHITCLARKGCTLRVWRAKGAHYMSGAQRVHITCLARKGCTLRVWRAKGAHYMSGAQRVHITCLARKGCTLRVWRLRVLTHEGPRLHITCLARHYFTNACKTLRAFVLNKYNNKELNKCNNKIMSQCNIVKSMQKINLEQTHKVVIINIGTSNTYI